MQISKVRKMTECAMLIALGTILSYFIIFSLPMGGTINFANGDRLAVTSLALNTISLEPGESGYYELQLVSPIMPLDDVLAAIG